MTVSSHFLVMMRFIDYKKNCCDKDIYKLKKYLLAIKTCIGFKNLL